MFKLKINCIKLIKICLVFKLKLLTNKNNKFKII